MFKTDLYILYVFFVYFYNLVNWIFVTQLLEKKNRFPVIAVLEIP